MGLAGLAVDAALFATCPWCRIVACRRPWRRRSPWRRSSPSGSTGALLSPPAADGRGGDLARYVGVTLVAQGFSYGLFLALSAAAPALPALVGADRRRRRRHLSVLRGPAPLHLPRRLTPPTRGRPRMRPDTDILIVGAGPAGLTAGYLLGQGRAGRLRRRARPALRRRHQPHGQLQGLPLRHRRPPLLLEVARRSWTSGTRSCPTTSSSGRASSRIFYGGKFYAYPLKAFEALQQPGPLHRRLHGDPIAWAKATPIADPKTFHQWVRNQFGEKLFSIFFKTYTEKVWGMSCDEISRRLGGAADQGPEPLGRGDRRAQALARDQGQARRAVGEQRSVKTLIESFRYPRRAPA